MTMKYLFLATDENKMQLYHLLLNANNFHENGHEVAVVLECASPKLLIGIADGSIKLPVFDKAMELGIIDHACKACMTGFIIHARHVYGNHTWMVVSPCNVIMIYGIAMSSSQAKRLH